MSRLTGSDLAGGAVGAVARHQLRRTWPRLLALGLAAGVLGAAVVGLAVAARRTSTAYSRLAEATHQEDATVEVFGDPALVDAVTGLPAVGRATVASRFVGAVEGPGLAYYAIRAEEGPDGLGRAAVVEGRPADPDDPDEVVVLDTFARSAGIGPGSTIPLCLLTTEEYAQFDTGFGAPDGPCTTLRVTGLARTASGGTGTGIEAGPAFVARYGSGNRVGRSVAVRLAPDGGGLPALEGAVRELAAANPAAAGAEEFPTLAVSTPADARRTAQATARVLVAGLSLCAAVAALVGLLLIGQALGRRLDAEGGEQRVEAALGLTPTERTLARVLPATLTAAVAALVTAAGALAAGVVEPLGPLAVLEPHPGWAPNLGLALLGAAGVAGATLALTAAAARRAGRLRPPVGVGRTRRRRGTLLLGGPTTVTGIALTVDRTRGAGRVPVRSTFTTVLVGVAGVAAALTFAASLDHLGAEPARWGWNADVAVVDAREDAVATVAADPRVEGSTLLHQVDGELGGRPVTLHTLEGAAPGGPGWTILEGRAPTGTTEVVLGPRLADALGADVGDEVPLALDDGTTRALEVVGTGLGPVAGREPFATSALVAPPALDGARATSGFDELLVRARPGQAGPVTATLAERWEITPAEPPREVRDVIDLGRIPLVLAGALGLVGAAALANGLAVVVRRRSRDLASLRAVGMTPAQVLRAVVAAAVGAVLLGLLVGLPLGVGLGRLTWWVVTDRVGLATDAAVPLAGLAAVVAGALAVAVAASLGPAWRAARLRPGVLLRID